MRAEKKVTFNTNMIETRTAIDTTSWNTSQSSKEEPVLSKSWTESVKQDPIKLGPQRETPLVEPAAVPAAFEKDLTAFKRVAWRPTPL